MDKPTYRHNHKTGKLDRTYRIDADVVEISGFVNPKTGIYKSFTLPRRFNEGSLNG